MNKMSTGKAFKYKLVIITIFVLIALLVFFLPTSAKRQKDTKGGIGEKQFRRRGENFSQKRLTCRYFDEARFKRSLQSGSDVDTSKIGHKERIKGGIVPHHLLADKMIADFFKVASESNPEVIIVIGPNHKGEGTKMIYTAGWDWNTPFGVLEADREITTRLAQTKTIGQDFGLMEREHSISCLVPYIKYFMPDAKIVPILMTATDKKDSAVELAKLFCEVIKGKKCLFIASVDFSHYLSLEKADEKDEISKQALLKRDINQIRGMGNDYMDSKISIIALLLAMNELGADEQLILEHNNSARISGEALHSTTSYFTVVYW